jgi:hypothetical protein
VGDLSRFDPEPQAGERATLEQFLDYQRQVVTAQLGDLTDEQARSRVLPDTDMTAAGILRHLSWAEDRWFQNRLLGVPLPAHWASSNTTDADTSFHTTDGDTVDHLLALYATTCERSRAAAAQVDLDTVAAAPSSDGEHASLRWILVHLIEEIARHAGHLDLIRDALGKPSVG